VFVLLLMSYCDCVQLGQGGDVEVYRFSSGDDDCASINSSGSGRSWACKQQECDSLIDDLVSVI
jgi:hypothetical protein